ncbi:SUMO-activating enzyme subunit 1B-2 [Chlorella vulgaris]
MSTPAAELSEQEAAIYDRQLRVWGVETQRRLSGAKVLIAGCGGLAAEVAKNVVLAGVGAVTLVDDTPCSRRSLSNFLVGSTTPDDTTVAEASVATLQEMNPFVKVAALPGPPEAVLAPDVLRQYDLLLLCDQPASRIAQADVMCREAGVAFYAGVCRGIFGWAFANLHQHRYIVERQEEQPDGSTSKHVSEHNASFATWEQATSCSLEGVNMRRFSKLFEQQQQRFPTAADADQLRALQQQVFGEMGVDAAALPDEMLQAYAAYGSDMPAINAIVGGTLGNELIKAVGGRNEPVNNFFLFSLAEGGEGVVECLPRPKPAAPAAAGSVAEEILLQPAKMGKVPIRLKEVTYMLSPFQQSVMGGLWKDLPHKAAHHAHNARDAIIFCVAPLVGIAYYCSAYKEAEKLHHRF